MAQNAHHSLGINVTAEVSDVERAVGKLRRSLNQMEGEIQGTARDSEELQRQNELAEQTAQRMGMGFVAAGGAIAAGLGLATRSAMQWELQFADVAKTVDGSDQVIQQLEEDIRGLARSIPVAHDELARIASIAGQLGIESEDITHFTNTIAQMAVATNMTAEEASFSLARFSTVMGITVDDIDNLASTIVHLGNNLAVTESEITQMSISASGAGRVASVAETDILAMSATLGAVGVKAEAGGTALSRFMLEVSTAVGTGSERLEHFSDVAGVTSEEFSQAYEEDAGDAILMFVRGLGDMVAAGEDVVGVLKDLNLNEIRVRRSLLNMAAEADVLEEAMGLANNEFENNQALMAETERRFETTAMQVQMARNNIEDAKITIGESFTPAVAQSAELVASLGAAFGESESGVESWVGWLALGVAGSMALYGAVILLPPVLNSSRTALAALEAQNALTPAGMMGRAGRFLTRGPVLAAIAAITTAVGALVAKQAESAAQTQQWVSTLREAEGDLSQMGENEFLDQIGFEEFSSAAADAGISIEQLKDMVEMSRNEFLELRYAAEGVEESVEPVAGHLREVDVSLDDAGMAFEHAGGGVTGFIESLKALVGMSSELDDAVNGNTEELDAYIQMTTGVAEVTPELRDQFLQVMEGVDEHNRALNDAEDVMSNTQTAQGDLSSSLEDLAQKEEDYQEAHENRVEALDDAMPKEWDMVDAQESVAEAIEQATENMEDGKGPIDTYKNSTAEQQEVIRQITEGIQDELEVMDELEGATIRTIEEAIDPHRESLRELRDQGLLTEDGFRELKQVIDDQELAMLQGGDQAAQMAGHMELLGDSVGLTEGETDTLQSTFFETNDRFGSLRESFENGFGTVDTLKRRVDDLKGSFKEEMDQMGLTEDQADDLWNKMLEGHGMEVDAEIGVSASGEFDWAAFRRSEVGLASGGAVPGDDPSNSDTVDARLTEGEHVFTRDEVRAMGGQENVYRFRRSLKSDPTGRISQIVQGSEDDWYNEFPGDPAVFKKGGMVTGTNKPDKRRFFLSNEGPLSSTKPSGDSVENPLDRFARELGEESNDEMDFRLQQMADELASMMSIGEETAWTNPSDRLNTAAAWAQSQDGKPYMWGGTGPFGYDCSGYVGSIQNVLENRNPFQRRFVTGSFQGANAPTGWVKNLKSPFMLGNTHAGVGHMAASIIGNRAEAAGSGKGVNFNGPARGATDPMFSSVYGYSKVLGEAVPTSPSSFDTGGVMRPGETGKNRSNMPERILSPQHTAAFDDLVTAVKGNGGKIGGDLTIHQHGVNGFSDIDEVKRGLAADQRMRRVGGNR